jgi:hypothetical protein
MTKKLIAIAAFSAFAATASTGAQAQDIYLGVGLPGLVTLGYAAPMGNSWGLRADYASGLNANLDGTSEGVRVTGKIKSSVAGAYADWFPFDNSGFRLVGGVTFNDTKADLNAVSSGTAVINGQTVNMAGEFYNVTVKMPSTTPYLGIGYGHQKAERGLGFYFDMGVMIGKLDVSSSTSLVTSGKTTQANVDAQNQKFRDSVASVGFIPSASLGLVYRF